MPSHAHASIYSAPPPPRPGGGAQLHQESLGPLTLISLPKAPSSKIGCQDPAFPPSQSIRDQGRKSLHVGSALAQPHWPLRVPPAGQRV